jgi:hypothetical protein
MIDVSVRHPSYDEFIQDTIAARDCFAGERAVKARGVSYLPQLSGQTRDEYNSYKLRATFYSIVGRTVTALTGLAMTGDPQIKASKEMLDQMIHPEFGVDLEEFRYKTLLEIQLVGRMGWLIDSPRQARNVGIIPYISESVINWELDGVGRPTMVMLMECEMVKNSQNPYKQEQVIRYRELVLEGGVYKQRVYDSKSTQLYEVVPSFGGRTLDYIPFFMYNPFGQGWEIEKTPLIDLVNLNLSHYRTSADLEHGRHFCGLPTPVITGSEVANNKLKIGGNRAWVLPEPGADAKYLEFTGQGLQSLEKALAEKEAQLSSLSVNVIDRSTRGSESPETVKMRYTSETASLALVVSSVQSCVTKVYNTIKMLYQWRDEFSIVFAKQFISGSLSAEEVSKYSGTYLAGGLSVESYVSLLRRGGTLSAELDDSTEIAALKKIADEKAQAAVEAARTPKSPPTN